MYDTVWRLTGLYHEHYLFHADFRDYSRLSIGDVDVLLTDPPYGHSENMVYSRDDDVICGNESEWAYEVLFDWIDGGGLSDTGMAWVFGDWRCAGSLRAFGNLSGRKLDTIIVWDKGNAGLGQGIMGQYELIARVVPGSWKKSNDPFQGNVWRHSRVYRPAHPHQKPDDLLARCLQLSPPGRVFDPFCGSGSTLIAAERSGRCSVGVECDPKQVERCLKRWMDEVGPVERVS